MPKIQCTERAARPTSHSYFLISTYFRLRSRVFHPPGQNPGTTRRAKMVVETLTWARRSHSACLVHRRRARCIRDRQKVQRLGRRPCGTAFERAVAVVEAVREAEAQPRLEPDALLELKQGIADKEWRQRASADIDQYLKERANLQRVRSMLQRVETLGMDAEDVEDFRQQELRLVTQCRDQEAGLDSLKQLRTAAGKVTAKRLASGADGCKELLALTPRGEELHEMVASCDDTSLEQLQERALEVLSTLHRETARRVGALLDSHGHAHAVAHASRL